MNKIIQMHDRMLSEVMDELTKAIEAEGIEFGEYGFQTQMYRDFRMPNEDWCSWRRVAVWPHAGSNEGWYIHLDLVNWRSASFKPAEIPGVLNPEKLALYQRETLNIGLAKTWSWFSAIRISEAAGRLLGAAGEVARSPFVSQLAL